MQDYRFSYKKNYSSSLRSLIYPVIGESSPLRDMLQKGKGKEAGFETLVRALVKYSEKFWRNWNAITLFWMAP